MSIETNDPFLKFSFNSWDSVNVWMAHWDLPTTTVEEDAAEEKDKNFPRLQRGDSEEKGVQEETSHNDEALLKKNTKEELRKTFTNQRVTCIDDLFALNWTQIRCICTGLSLQDGINFKISLGLLDPDIVPGRKEVFDRTKDEHLYKTDLCRFYHYVNGGLKHDDVDTDGGGSGDDSSNHGDRDTGDTDDTAGDTAGDTECRSIERGYRPVRTSDRQLPQQQMR